MNRGHPEVVFGALAAVMVFAILYSVAMLTHWPLTLPYERLRDADLAAGLLAAAAAGLLLFRRRRGKLE